MDAVDAVARPEAAAAAPATSKLEDYLALAKPRVVFLIGVTVAVGFCLGSGPVVAVPQLLLTIAGTMLAGAGSLALNQLLERDQDARMQRTRDRPLPGGRLQAREALGFGVALVAAGLGLLTVAVDPVAGLLTALTVALYLFVYTPLKRVSTVSTLLGAIPGALPPVTGWVAASGQLGAGALSLFGLLFFWQIPHSLAIARLYRDEYRAAGFRLLPVVDEDGPSTGRQALLHAIATLAAGMLPALVGIAGPVYAGVNLVLGLGLVVLSAQFAWRPAEVTARRLFVGSLVHMPVILAALFFDRVPL